VKEDGFELRVRLTRGEGKKRTGLLISNIDIDSIDDTWNIDIGIDDTFRLEYRQYF